MKRNPLVSICIPNYNNARYLDMCLASAVSQTYKPMEIIFVDDGSTDNSREIAYKYSDSIEVHPNRRNFGQPKTTNRAITISQGEYVVILHSDDMLMPDFAERLVPLLEENKTAGMAVGERILIDENNVETPIAPFYNTDCLIPGMEQARIFMLTSFLPCQVLVRRRILDEIGGINERHIINLDGLLWFSCAMKADIVYTQAPVCFYRIHEGQVTAQYNRTINHMMEYYVTLTEMFRLAKGTCLEQYFPAAVKRTAELTLRYAREVEDPELARRYAMLATIFDPDIDATILPAERHKDRGFSYDPPEGSIKR